MKKNISVFKIILSFVTLSYLALFNPNTLMAQAPKNDKIKAVVTVFNEKEIKVKLSEGNKKDEVLSVAEFDRKQRDILSLDVGDTVYVSFDPVKGTAMIVDHYRLWPLFFLSLLFLAVVVLIGRKKGLLSIIAMVISFFIIINGVVPQILLGNNPVLISLLASLIIIPFNFYMSHGFSRKTTIAVVSTFITLVITGILSVIFVHLSKLTGFASEEATFLSLQVGKTVDIKALLLSGIIIGAMGVLDDITISQTSIVEKLKKANPKFNKWELFRESMDLGRDHIASLVNTLILVYAGASLPLFVLFSGNQFGTLDQVVNMEVVATEVVRTLVSSIGIICAVPISSYLSAVKS